MKAIWRFSILFVSCFVNVTLAAQEDSVWHQKPTLLISGYADVFYVYDFSQNPRPVRQSFLFNHNRHHEINLNSGIIKLGLEQKKYRANIALQSGTYVNDNYASEPGVLKNIFEANVGISLHKKNKLWLDAGVLPSPIGFESVISFDNLTMTRSLLAENSPYYLTGAKLTYNPSEKWEIAGLIINGWQRIQRLEGNSMPSFGTQLTYRPREDVVLNWSTFIGTDDPDTTRRIRLFNNFYGKVKLSERFGFIAGIDFGIQQKSKNSSEFDLWYSPVFIGQFTINKNWDMALRMEYYRDEFGIIIPTVTTNGFQTKGMSINLDYKPSQHIICRFEGRWLNSKDKIFETKTTPTNNNFIIGTSMSIKFSEAIKK